MTTSITPSTEFDSTPLLATIAASRLVDGLELHRAASHVVSQRPTSVDDHDRRLAERLVEAGLLNSWQIGQLKRGRTKFNLGPYRILDSIARGGMGHVFKCQHEMLGRIEAIKVLPRSKSTPDAVASFRHEIRAQAALDHPNLVRVSYADRDGDTYYLVTEYVPGIDLRRLIRRGGPLEESTAAWALSQAAEAISHAHRRGLVHRDVKPGNLLLTPTGTVKVTDLGLATSVEGLSDSWIESTAGTQSGKIAGTSDYVAPESIREPDRVRPASDLYGLGCTLYYTVTGKVPFPGGTHADKLRRRLRDEPISPDVLVPELSGTLVGLITRLMAQDPADRPDSAAEVAAELSAMAEPEAAAALATVVTETMSQRPAVDDPTPSWGSDDLDDLPETVGLPLHDLENEILESLVPELPPGNASKLDANPPPASWSESVPYWIAAAALLATVVLAGLAAWRGVAS